MTDTSGGEPTIAEVLTAINGLRVNGPEPVRALREDILALGNRTQRLIDGLRGDMEQRFGLLMTPSLTSVPALKRTREASGMRRTGHLHPTGLLDRIDIGLPPVPWTHRLQGPNGRAS